MQNITRRCKERNRKYVGNETQKMPEGSAKKCKPSSDINIQADLTQEMCHNLLNFLKDIQKREAKVNQKSKRKQRKCKT